MLEIYEIVWRNKDVTGYLEYNTKTDKFQAYLKDRENPNPRGLFGILKIGLMFLVMMISANTFLTSGTQS